MVLDYSRYLGAGGLNPLDSVVRGIGQGQAIRGNELAIQKQQQNMDIQRRVQEQAMAQRKQQQEMLVKQQQDLVNFVNKPNKTYEDYANYAVLNPSMQKSIVENFEFRSKAQQENLKRQGSIIFSSLQNEKPEIAKRTLENLLNSAEQRGDQQSVAAFDAILESIDVDPNYALSMMGNFLNAVDPQNFANNLETMTDIKQSQEMQPFEIKAKQAEIRNKLANEGKTNAEINKILAETRKLGAETQNIAVNMEIAKSQNNGVLPRDKIFDFEKKIRDDYQKRIGESQKVLSAYRRVQASENTAVGDLSLIFGFMKMLDPGSVVREGEFANAQNAAGVPDRIVNIYNKIISGERLNSEQRKSFKKQAEKLYTSSRKSVNEAQKDLGIVIKNYGLNPDNVFGVGVQEEATEQLTKQKPPQDETDPEKLLQYYIR